MTVLHSGTTKQFSDNWAEAFGAPKASKTKSAAAPAAAKKKPPASTKKKAAPKKAAKKSK